MRAAKAPMAPPERSGRPGPPDRWEQLDGGDVAPTPSVAAVRKRAKLPPDVREGLRDEVGAASAVKIEAKLVDARRAFERERYEEARAILVPVAQRSSQAAAVRELLGLTFYRLGRWKSAIGELEAYRDLTGAVDQLPVHMDCERALKHWNRVEDLWAELKAASPSAALVAEGRIVAAGAKADRGDIKGALAVLRKIANTPVDKPKDHHLRQWYVLGDLNERAGNLPLARAWFKQVRDVDTDFADVADRVKRLR
jgi:tetratricopeptide (TPR) repeat protein